MNYTGRPSISGCRPVLSLYPTHHFCQYLLGIFITFTNSSLFCRAFSTNSRSPLRQRLSLWERSSTSPSRLTPCHLPYRGEALAFRKVFLPSSKFSSPPEAPLLGELSSEARLRGCTKGSLTVSTKKDPLSEIGAPGGGLSFWVSQWTHLLPHLPSLLYAIPRKSQALHRKFAVTLLLASPVSFWRNMWYNGFAALPAHFMGREVKPNGVYFYLCPVRRSECSVLLHLQVA